MESRKRKRIEERKRGREDVAREGEAISPSRAMKRGVARENSPRGRRRERERERERERNKEKFHFIIKQNYILDKSKSLNIHKMLLNYEKSRISFKT